jgi:hypothetical protein
VVNYFMNYDFETGTVTWRFNASRYMKAGKSVGSVDSTGYYQTRFLSHSYKLHRLCWLLYYKEDPGSMCVDHIDGNKINNKIENLRLATYQQNRFNSPLRSNNKTGATGVYWSKRSNCYIAKVCMNGRQVYSGHFSSFQDAVNARNNAAKNIFKEFARINQA